MTENTSSLGATSFDEEDDFSWLLEYLETEVDWDGRYNDEYLKARDYAAESLMCPTSMLHIPKNTPGGAMYHKLRIAAKEEREKEREYQIAIIHQEEFSNMDLARGQAMAALTYAKRVLADRPQYTAEIRGGYVTTSCPYKTSAAVETLTKGRKYGVRYRKNQYGNVTYNTTGYGQG
jgi:hypothetical protein